MSSLVQLPALKAQLRLSAGDTSEDGTLQLLLDAAEGAVARHLDRPEDAPALDAADLAIKAQAVLVWASALYEDRVGGDDVPPAVAALLRPLRSWAR
jgi:hypothetical protein